MTLDEIITEKLSRLNSIPDKLITDVEIAQRELYTTVLELLSQLQTKGDTILKTKKNLALIDEIISDLRTALENESGIYVDSVQKFVDEMKVQQGLTNKYFKGLFDSSAETTFSSEVAILSQKQAANLLLGSAIESSFFDPIREQITNAVVSGSSYQETVKALRQVVIGDPEKDGVLQSHVKQIAHDVFAIADRSYTSVLSDEMGVEWYKWAGSNIKTSTPFCDERTEQYFHKKEIEAWGRGEKTLGMKWPKDGTWQGKALGENEKTIFNWGHGYNCRRSVIPVSIDRVPKAAVQRAVDQGFYTPK